MPSETNQYELDPVFLNSRREAKFILTTFFLFAIYTIAVSYTLGYSEPSQEATQPSLILGMPHWVFWGIVVPWLAANVVTGWFCFCFMRDDPLEASGQPEVPRGESPEPSFTWNQTVASQTTEGKEQTGETPLNSTRTGEPNA